jgi:hypothetical protein
MSDFSSRLGLSDATLQRLSDAYEGYAAASGIVLHNEPQQNECPPAHGERELLMGSCYVLAAIYRSILDPGTSVSLFGIAAGIYRRQNSSFWKPLAVCGLNREWLLGQEAGRVEGNPQEFFYELLRQYYLFNTGDENALGRMLEYASSSPALLAQPVGSPSIPLYEYITFMRSDIEKVYYNDNPAGSGSQAWTAGLRVLLQRTAAQLQLAQSNRFQWNNEIGLLPFEPDILATLLGFCIRDRNRAEMRLFAEEGSLHDNPAHFLVRLALEMIAASR